MNNKINLAILTGGTSEEHEISLLSGFNIAKAINLTTYNLYIIGINKNGEWQLYNDFNYLSNENNPKTISLKKGEDVIILPNKKRELYSLSKHKKIANIDVIFSTLHGKDGEDGNMQGLLNLSGIPYVGSKVLGSCIGMDKHYTKKILLQENLPTAKFITLLSQNHDANLIFNTLGKTVFVKPANQGSSVGVSKVRNESELKNAIELAFKFDNKVLIEEYISGRELECAVLGNKNLIVSSIGEIVTSHDFYSYEAKYVDPNGATTKILSEKDIDSKIIAEIQELSKKAFNAISCQGLARVDFFLTKDNKLFINEINTLPGFTNISMYPQLFLNKGYSYSKLIEELINLAIS